MAPTTKSSAEGGWGWMVVLGGAIVSVMNGLNYRLFGLVYLELRDKFQGSSTASVWVGGLNILLGGFCGPVTVWLLGRYSNRQVCIIGTTMAAIGMSSTGFVPNLACTYVTYGTILGIGIAITSTSSVAMVGTYFDRRKGLALAVQHSAGGLSAFVFAPMMVYFMEEFSYSGTFLIFGGIFMHMYISSALFRPIKDNRKESQNGSSSPEIICETKDGVQYCEEVKSGIITKDYHHHNQTVPNTEKNKDDSLSKDHEEKVGNELLKNTEKNSVVLVTGKLSGNQEIQNNGGTAKGRYLKYMTPFIKLKHPTYAIFLLLMLSVGANRAVTASFLPALAIEMGSTLREASFLPAIGGVTAVVCSLIVGVLFDVPYIRKKRVYIYTMCTFLAGLTVLVMPLTQKFYFLTIPTAIHGGCSTIAFAQQLTVLGDVLGKDHAVAGLGLAKLALALGSITGRTVSAVFVDFLETHSLGFYTMSTLPMISSVTFIIFIKSREKLNVDSPVHD